MSEDYFEIAWINFEKAILHGRRADQSLVEMVLNDEQREQVSDLNAKHDREMQKLLRGLAA